MESQNVGVGGVNYLVESPKLRKHMFLPKCAMILDIVGPGVRPFNPHVTTHCGEKSLMTVKKLYGEKTQFSILCYAN